jgi:protein transport protein SEC24
MQNIQPPQFGPASLAPHNNQFSAPPQFIQPAIPPQFQNANQFQHSVPHGYSQSHLGDPNAAYENLSSQFQNMSFQSTRHVPFNLLTSSPNATELAQTDLPCLIPYTSAVTQHPMSNCDPEFKRCTLRHIPASQALLSKSKLPFGLLLTPYKVADEKTEIPVINPEVIVRCRRCR